MPPTETHLRGLTPEQLRDELRGLPPETVEAALRYQTGGDFADLESMLPGVIAYHLPSGAPRPPAILKPEMRLREEIGLDSLALAEMAFKLDQWFGVPIEMNEVSGVATVADLQEMLRKKLNL